MAQWLMNPTRNDEVVGSTLALLSGLRIGRCCELWCRAHALLGSAATALIQPLAWEPPYAMGVALKRQIYMYVYI